MANTNPVMSPFQQTALFNTAANAAAVTPHDTDELTHPCACLRVGGAGNIVVKHAGNEAEITYAVAAGAELRVKASMVLATGTTATNIVAWW